MIEATLYQFELPLRRPLTTGSADGVRTGFLVALEDGGGHVGWGEASPLPGLSPDNLSSIRQEWQDHKPRLQALELPGGLDLDGLRSSGEHITSPSLKFGVETAYARLVSARGGRTWPLCLNPQARRVVECNALIAGPAETWREQLVRVVHLGYRCVKVKMGRDGLDRELECFQSLAESTPAGLTWRIDANQAWTLEETSRVLSACRNLALEYIEEPLRDAKDWPEALRLPDAKLAMDEHLLHIAPNQLAGFRKAAAIILKPSLLGGIHACWEWAEAAREHGLACTLSSIMESGCGLQAIAELCSALPDPPLAAGLDTAQWLVGDTLASGFALEDGGLYGLCSTDTAPAINRNCIQEVA